MKELVIILRRNCYYKTKEALSERRLFAMSSKEVLGRGRAMAHYTTGDSGMSAADIVYENSLVAKRMIEMVVPDERVQEVIDVVLSVNSHNVEGDGKIFVLPVEESIRIHTCEKGEDALI